MTLRAAGSNVSMSPSGGHADPSGALHPAEQNAAVLMEDWVVEEIDDDVFELGDLGQDKYVQGAQGAAGKI
eukprot:6700389-Lingulodinium_polyedra.AAC.1